MRDRAPGLIYDPIKRKFSGLLDRFYNKQLELYNSINYTIVFTNEYSYGNCDSGNCTSLIGLIQRGEADFSEKLYSFATIPDSVTGLKPGPVLGDVSCYIISALPKVGIIREDSNSPPIIWPLICAILRKESKIKSFNRQSLSFIWISITLTLFFITALYSGSFTTDLTSKASIKTIDSLEDVANCDRIPLWMEEPSCRTRVNSGSLRARTEILRRGQFKTLGGFLVEIRKKKDLFQIKRYVFIISEEDFYDVKLGYCAFLPGSPIPLFHQSTGSFPTDLWFTVLHSKLPQDATKIINQLHEKHFESGILDHAKGVRLFQLDKLLDPKQEYRCLTRISMSFNPALHQFNQLVIQNYKLFFNLFLYTIPIGILSLIGEYLYAEINSALTK
uniref:Ionotropic glutamate receptor C-terminal domain-containing protein n=1 Tax=Tetranychus urticae TaxID=32264 RepID=T1KGN7_TETUR